MAIREGVLCHKRTPIPPKKYKDGKTYLSISIFRMGLAIIQNLFTSINKLFKHIENRLKVNNDGINKDFEKLILMKNV